jgi:hypothetical protein
MAARISASDELSAHDRLFRPLLVPLTIGFFAHSLSLFLVVTRSQPLTNSPLMIGFFGLVESLSQKLHEL